jgi:hypothetical protein
MLLLGMPDVADTALRRDGMEWPARPEVTAER